MMKRVAVVVVGGPVSQGSMHAIPFVRGKLPGGKQRLGVAVKHDNEKELKAWRRTVAYAFRGAVKQLPEDGPIGVILTFYLARPASRPKRHVYPDRQPDVDKLQRAIFDALEKIVWTNDSRVCSAEIHKRYGTPRVVIVARSLEDEDFYPNDGLLPGDPVYAQERKRRLPVT